MERNWNYKQLPEGFYAASLGPMHDGKYHIFRAIPNRGSCCTECVEADPAVLLAKVERWLAGEMPAGFYAAAF